jgi:hypothetical protein
MIVLQLKYRGQERYGEVLYFTRLAVEADLLDDADWRFADIAVIRLYSLPDNALLQLSSRTVASCSRLDDICVVPVKKIISVIAMIPHKPKLPSGIIKEQFFLLEKPGLQISNLGINHVDEDDNDNDGDVE